MTKPLFDVFRDSMLANPNGSRKEAQDVFIATVKSDPAYLDMLATDYFTRMAAVYVVKQEEPHTHAFVRTDVSREKGERISAALVSRTTIKREDVLQSAQRTETAFADLKTKIREVILLDLLLPNGVRLRHATGAELAKAGGFYAEVAKHLKPNQVVDRHLNEANLRDIRSRFYQQNVEAKSA